MKFKSLIVILFSATNIYSQVGLNKLAQSTMNFLLIGLSPKASAMGESYYAVGTGAESIFYNPAGLAEMNNNLEVTLNYTQWIADINYLGGAVGWSLGNFGTVGFNLITVDYGTINGTSLITSSQQSQYPLGYIDNGEIGNVGAYAFGLSYAKAVTSQFFIGGNVKIAGQNLGENHFANGQSKTNNAKKLVFDMGVKYYTGYKNFRFGMAIRNFSSNIRREEIDEQLPLTFTIGTAIDALDFINPARTDNSSLTLAVDFLHSNNFSERVNIGTEYKFLDMIAVRAGYQTNRDVASWSAGIGLNTTFANHSFNVNYSFSKMDIFSDVSRLSVGFIF